MPLGVVVSDDDLELLGEPRETSERESHRPVSLRRHDSEPTTLRSKPRQDVDHAVEGLEGLVQRVVVLPIHLDELVDPTRPQLLHLRDEALAADRRRELLVPDVAVEHGADGVLHRREDDRPGIDQRAVEVEEDDAEAHARSKQAQGRGQASA